MTKLTILILILMIFTGCVRTRLSSWQDNQFSICCDGSACGESDLIERAPQHCDGEVEMVGGHESSNRRTIYLGNNTFMKAKPDQCAVFECTGKIKR